MIRLARNREAGCCEAALAGFVVRIDRAEDALHAIEVGQVPKAREYAPCYSATAFLRRDDDREAGRRVIVHLDIEQRDAVAVLLGLAAVIFAGCLKVAFDDYPAAAIEDGDAAHRDSRHDVHQVVGVMEPFTPAEMTSRIRVIEPRLDGGKQFRRQRDEDQGYELP